MSYTAQSNALSPNPPPPHSPTKCQGQGQSSSASTQLARPLQPVHKRTYQACIPCRQRKVRCDLGSVEAPHDPPCVRCRRESKDCYFSATRRKRTPSAEGLQGLGRGRVIRKLEDGHENGDAKRVRTLPNVDEPVFRSPDGLTPPQQSPTFLQQPQQQFPHAIDPQLSRPQPLQPPLQPAQHGPTTTETLLQTEVYNSHEALLALVEAAGKDTPMDSMPMKSETRSPSTEVNDSVMESVASSGHSQLQSPAQPTSTRWNQQVHFADTESVAGNSSYSHSHPHRKSMSHISPTTQTPRSLPGVSDDGMEKACKAWSKFRFVKAGWFTAREAISFVEYFYKHLHPLSPTLTNPSLFHVSHPRYHPLLLRHEPFLATTILTVASRYLILPPPGGQSRSFAIHDMLWREVRGAFERLMWGGGWGGPGVPRPTGMSNLAVDPANGAKTGRGLRTIGTVEGLLILTEWHVRGLHFPMDVEECDLGIDLTDDESTPPSPKRHRVVEGLGDKIENILEPAYRSDRMSWMLLGNALALAYELGVFDEVDHNAPSTAPTPTPPLPLSTPPFRVRSKRIQKLLLVYVLQLASRLGWTSMIPRGVRDTVRHKPPTPPNPGNWNNPDELQDAIYDTWVDLTMLMNTSSEMLFPSRSVTRQIMRSGKYVEMLEHFRPLLRAWKEEFLALNLPAPIHHILVLEYEHVRFYVNSLALQAVIDRCSHQSSGVLAAMGPRDTEFIREVVAASRSLLTTVIDDMLPAGYLKHAPVRIYLRILSASMFLLKTFSLGAKEVEVERSMELIEGVCVALRSDAVDDVHLGLRFADLLGGLAGSVRGALEKMVLHEGSAPPVAEEAGEGLGDAGNSAGNSGYMWEGGGEEVYGGWGQWGNDWLALPLDPILEFEGVTQGTMGVDVGGMDLLEVLLAPAAV